MKIVLITDTHWGVRNDNVAFLDNSKRFLDNIFFPYLEQQSITTVVHLGDLVDRRKYINISTANRLRNDFLDKLKPYDVHLIAGNHDTYFKNTNNINALREIVDGKYNFKIYDMYPTEVNFGGTSILLIPWICDDNRQRSLEIISESRSQITMGHLELQGFEMYKGSLVSHGDDPSLFGHFDMVLSGHYHHRSSSGNVFYLGSHAEFTWSDYGDPKGFHVLDTETKELTFIENPYNIFKKIWYDDLTKDYMNESIDYSEVKDCIVRVVVTNKTNPYMFDMFIEKLENSNPISIQIVEDHLNLNVEDDETIIDEAESTLTIFKKYIDANEISVDKNKLVETITELYNDALAME